MQARAFGCITGILEVGVWQSNGGTTFGLWPGLQGLTGHAYIKTLKITFNMQARAFGCITGI